MVEVRVNSEGITECTITNASGASVTLSARGARIVSVRVADQSGRMDDIVIDRDHGADTPVFDCQTLGDDAVLFALSPSETIEYRWTTDCTLETYLSRAGVGLQTVSFDLDGRGGKVSDQYLWVNATSQINRSGEILTVKDTPLDFTTAKHIGADTLSADYQICDWEEGVMSEVAVMASHLSGREVRVYSTYPLCEISVHDGGLGFDCYDNTSPRVEGPQLIFYEFRCMH